MAESPEIAVARYAASISLWALGIAGGSLAITTGLFCLEVRRWFDEGVRLSMSVIVEAKLYGGPVKDENTYLAITLTNRGSAPTTLTNMVLYDFPSRLARWLPSYPKWLVRWLKSKLPKTMIVPNPGNQPLPYVLEPGYNWHGRVIHNSDLIKMIDKGGLYVGVVGSHSDKAFLKPVRKFK